MTHLITTTDELKQCLPILGRSMVLGFDVEATGLDALTDKLLLVQLECDGDVYLFDARKVDIRELAPVLENPKIVKVAHNAKYDYKMVFAACGVRTQNLFCTQVAEQLITAGSGKKYPSLADVVHYYCGVVLDKSVVQSFIGFPLEKEFSNEQVEYAATDVKHLKVVRKLQQQAITQYRLNSIAELEFAVIAPCAEMELNGMPFDKVKWIKHLNSIHAQLYNITARLLKQLPTPPTPPPNPRAKTQKPAPVLNLNSWQQIKDAFESVGIDLAAEKAKTRAGWTDNRTLKSALKTYEKDPNKRSILVQFLEYRRLNQIVKTFGFNLVEHVQQDGRIHADFNQLGADSGRFSSSNPNLQNILGRSVEGAILRSSFRTRPGYKFIIADYSQIELRIAAELSQDQVMIGILSKPGGDMHRDTGALMYGIKPEDVTPDIRRAAKALNFGVIYGIGPNKFSEQVHSSVQEAIELIDRYKKTYPQLTEYLEREADASIRRGFVKTIGGRIRWFPNDLELVRGYDATVEYYRRAAKNHGCQGTSADMTKTAIVFIHRRLPNINGKMVNTIHDEICIEVPDEYVHEAAQMVKNMMLKAGSKFVKSVPVMVDVKIRDWWWKDDGVKDSLKGQQLWLLDVTDYLV